MVEQGVMVEYGREKMAVASSSMSITTVPPVAEDYHLYPSPLATYEEVVASPQRFLETLQKFHGSMRTKFRIPIVGGQELDLYRLFVEVTSRGGVMKTLQDKKWKEVTGIFNFPASATNACFILRKHYFAMLYHYEQVYFLKARGWSPNSIGTFESTSKISGQPLASAEPKMSPLAIQAPRPEEERERFAEQLSGAGSRSSSGTAVNGVIDGKFDGGYLITVQIGLEKCRGILYQTPLDTSGQEQNHQNIHQYQGTSVNVNNSLALAPRVIRRRRRRKSEIRKRDPGHPKPNRSGYNFFFKEHHARLKQLYPGKDKAVSRIVGESWNKLTEAEKAVYRDKAAKDKERYRMEMQTYRERTGTGQLPHESHLNFAQVQNMPQNKVANSYQPLSNQHVSAFQRTADSGSLYPQPFETDNLEESDDKFQSDDDDDNSGSSFENENSSNMSDDSESDLYTTQTTAMQEGFHRLGADANMVVQVTTTSNRGNSSRAVAEDGEMRDHKEKTRDMTDENAGDGASFGKKAGMGFVDNQRMQNAA